MHEHQTDLIFIERRLKDIATLLRQGAADAALELATDTQSDTQVMVKQIAIRAKTFADLAEQRANAYAKP